MMSSSSMKTSSSGLNGVDPRMLEIGGDNIGSKITFLCDPGSKDGGKAAYEAAVTSSSSASYLTGLASRCVRAVPGSAASDRHIFVAGTSNLRLCFEPGELHKSNSLHFVEYKEGKGASGLDGGIEALRVVPHEAGEVWDIAPHPHDASLLATVYTSVRDGRVERKAALWAMDDSMFDSSDDGGSDNHLGQDVERSGLERRFEFTTNGPSMSDKGDDVRTSEQGELLKVLWGPADGSRDGAMLTLAERVVKLWDVDEECCVASLGGDLKLKGKE